MIKSMTGFASAAHEDELAALTVTVRSVNHRYLDLHVRLPPALQAHEPRLRSLAQQRIARGRVELTVTLVLRRASAVEVELNEAVIGALQAALEPARLRGHIAGPLTPGDLLRLPQALTLRERPLEADAASSGALAQALESLVGRALGELDVMRAQEGTYLRRDLDARRAVLADLLDRIEMAAREGEAALRSRLETRLQELTSDLGLEPAAMAQEVVRLVARSDISEEVVRFRSHLAHWQVLADAPDPCGRKLDFLLQEMHREVNTLGAKGEGAPLAELIVAAKADLEKMREQVQNVE